MDWRSGRFGRSAATYHEATPVQARMASTLAGMLPSPDRTNSVLELGAGTGHLTRELAGRLPHARILATDLSTAMVREAKQRMDRFPLVRWEILDGRTPDHPRGPFDLVASNAMVQWFPDLEAHLAACRTQVAPGGHLAVGGFCHDHFPELDAILRSEEFGYGRGPGHDPDLLPELLARTGFAHWDIRTASWTQTYDSARGFLEHLRESGANRAPPQGGSLGKARLARLLERLEETCRTPGGIAITWKPWFLVAG